MPQPRIPEPIRQTVFAMLGRFPSSRPPYTTKSAPEVTRALELSPDIARRGWAVPSERTVRRIIAEFAVLEAAERRAYALAQWPQSFLSGALRWEDSAATIELLRMSHREHAEGGTATFLRPTCRVASWFARVSQILPDANPRNRAALAVYLAAGETGRATTGKEPIEFVPTSEVFRRVEAALLEPEREFGSFGVFVSDADLARIDAVATEEDVE